MPGIVTLIIFLFISFGSLTIFRKWADSFVLIAFAIGSVVNANIYHATSTPVVVGPLVFGIDAILYTLFLYILCLKLFFYPLKDAQITAYASVIAIVISAFIELFAKLSAAPHSTDTLYAFLSYVFSALGSLIAVFFMGFIIKEMEKRHINRHLSMSLAIIVASILNSLIFFGCNALLNKESIEYFVNILLGSIVGKTVSILVANLCLFISTKYWIPNEIKAMERNK